MIRNAFSYVRSALQHPQVRILVLTNLLTFYAWRHCASHEGGTDPVVPVPVAQPVPALAPVDTRSLDSLVQLLVRQQQAALTSQRRALLEQQQLFQQTHEQLQQQAHHLEVRLDSLGPLVLPEL
ncbi:hypothetical protein SAMN05421823_1195 [Catalinimonas alkaloidigena]|uniref:Uncharacterized protein n=1 Tax=Catalinimonas alkaloidigena TaxID=1075417 RepID=A0A1G9V3G8_9BACT|nr:hypothetical protein [Catalinimonas alkaloidigena]SDM66698.1 hypothetical protein SAMN05421823_1195 [Catalinimonas alkaloidigena]